MSDGLVSNADELPEIDDDDRRFLHDNPNTDDLVEYVQDYAQKYAAKIRAQLAEAQRQRDAAQANYQFMVNRVADEKLDGYRELGQRAADAESRAEKAEAERGALVAILVSLRKAISNTGREALEGQP